MKTEEEVLYSQHVQIKKLVERSELIKEETARIQEISLDHSVQLADMETDLKDMFAKLGIDIQKADLSDLQGIVKLSEAEIEAIEKRISIPPLEVLHFRDWDSFVSESRAFLTNECKDTVNDPVFEMLSITEIAEVLQKYKDDYGEIFLDWKDYAIVFIAAAVGALVNQLAPKKLTKCTSLSEAGVSGLLDESMSEWKSEAKNQISTIVGFDTEDLLGLRAMVINQIGSQTGFESDSLDEIQQYLSRKIKKGEKFSPTNDALYVYPRLPKGWQVAADDWLSERTGWTLNEILSIQDFVGKKFKSGDVDISKDAVAAYKMLPKAWQELGKEKILGRVGLSLADVERITAFIEKRIRVGNIKPFHDLIELINMLPRAWKDFLSCRIAETIGFDIRITEDIQEYLCQRILRNDFDLVRDAGEIFQRFPEDWRSAINRAASSKCGLDISLTDEIQDFITQKMSEKNFDWVSDGVMLLQRLPDPWRIPISDLISEKVGFDITAFQGIQNHILDRIREREFDYLEDGIELVKLLPENLKIFLYGAISDRIGFDISTTSEMQEFILKKVQSREFDLLADIPELLSCLPVEWQESLCTHVSSKIGIDVRTLGNVQHLLTRKLKQRQFDVIEDGIELIQALPEGWKGSINHKISEKTGLDTRVIAYSMGANLAQFNQMRSDPVYFISHQIQTYIENNGELSGLQRYVDLERLAETIVLVIDVIKAIFLEESKDSNERLGEQLQKLLLAIMQLLEPSKEQLLQVGAKFISNKMDGFASYSDVFAIDDWIANSGLTLTIDDLLAKLNSEDAQLFTDEEVLAFGRLFSTILKQSRPNEVLSENIEKMLCSTPVTRAYLHDKGSIRKLAAFLEYATSCGGESGSLNVGPLAIEMVRDIQTKLDILPSMMFQSGSQLLCDPGALGNWLHDNGLSFQNLRRFGLTSALIEIIIRGWYLTSLYNETGAFKKEPYAVKVSSMLASAHIFSNLPALAQIAGSMPRIRVNLVSLGLGTKYALSALNEYARREKQIQRDLNEKLTSLYNYSLLLLQPQCFED